MENTKVNSIVSPDAAQSLRVIADKHHNKNKTAALNSLLLGVGLTMLDEPMQFKTWLAGERVDAWALPEVILGENGWANLRVGGEIIPFYQEDGVWIERGGD